MFPSSMISGREPVDPNKRYPNPSFGLEIWGPLVPANDCRSCLYLLTSIQLASGLLMWWVPGRGGMAKAAAEQAARMGTIVPPTTIWKNRLLRVTGILTGSYLIFLASLEIIRLQLPHDPWQADAAAARKKAEQEHPDQKVSRWFGPKGYRAVEYKEWKRRVDARFETAQVAHQKSAVVRDSYSEMRHNNREVAREILRNGLKDDDERLQHNAKPSIFIETENKSSHHSKDESSKKDDDESTEEDEVLEWNNMIPWENLREETDVQIRLIPHTTGVDETTAGNPEVESFVPKGEVSSIFLSIDDDEKSDRT